MKIRYAFATAAFLTLAPFAVQAEPSASHKAAAEKLINLTKSDVNMESTLNLMMNMQLRPSAKLPCYPTMVPELKTFFTNNFSVAKLRPFLINLYAESFTEKELGEITTFYGTPTGQKLLASMPKLAEAGMNYSKSLMEQKNPELKTLVGKYVDDKNQCKAK